MKRVKKTTDDMLSYTETTKLMKSDFKANLKTVKKEEEKVRLSVHKKHLLKYQTTLKPISQCIVPLIYREKK